MAPYEVAKLGFTHTYCQRTATCLHKPITQFDHSFLAALVTKVVEQLLSATHACTHYCRHALKSNLWWQLSIPSRGTAPTSGGGAAGSVTTCARAASFAACGAHVPFGKIGKISKIGHWWTKFWSIGFGGGRGGQLALNLLGHLENLPDTRGLGLQLAKLDRQLAAHLVT